MMESAGLDPDPRREALAAMGSEGACSEFPHHGSPCHRLQHLSRFCSFVVVQGHNRALTSTPLWIKTKSSVSDTENSCLG